MKYFYDCKTKDEAKLKYYDLCKRNHPDVGGSNEIMKEINRQYEEFSENTVKDPYGYSHTFYGAGFNSNKYTDMQGREYSSRFDKQTHQDIFSGLDDKHPIRNYCKMQEERIKNLHKYNDHLTDQLKPSINREMFDILKKQNSDLHKENDKLHARNKRLKTTMSKSKPKKDKKKCAIEPSAENVIVL